MKIAVLSLFPFPFGMAATNRMAAYTKGLVENNVDVDVITLHSTEPAFKGDSMDRLPDEGLYNGVHYIHPTGRYRNGSKILRGLAMKTGWRFLYGAYKVEKLLKRNSYDAVILGIDEPYQLWVYARMAHKYGTKAFFIFDEYPIPIRHKLKNKIPKWKEKAYSHVLKLLDGYISISAELVRYYDQFCQKPHLILPVIVDMSRFPQLDIRRNDWISYIGNMEITKDNVDLIAKAFSKIANKYKTFSLHYFGPKNNNSVELIKNVAKDNALQDRIIIEGPIKNDQVVQVISKSKIMVSSQPDTLRAKGGFPTKLGEYVLTGTPTLLCDVGENSKYLTSDDCYFVEPENPEAYAKQLDYILSHYEEALEVASHGRKTIINNYSQFAAGNKIKTFIGSIL